VTGHAKKRDDARDNEFQTGLVNGIKDIIRVSLAQSDEKAVVKTQSVEEKSVALESWDRVAGRRQLEMRSPAGRKARRGKERSMG
jgi:hypothetical protein